MMLNHPAAVVATPGGPRNGMVVHEWAVQDLNLRLPACKAGALAN